MKALQQNTLVTYIDYVPDPRCEGMCLHNFIDILIIAICAVLCGAETWQGIANLAVRKKAGCPLSWSFPMGSHPMTLSTELFACLIPPPSKCVLHDGFPILSEIFPAMGLMLSPLMESVFEAQEANLKRLFIW